MKALALGIALTLVLVAIPSSGEIVAPGHGLRFLFCPGYRAKDPAPSSGDVNRGKVDPLWLLQNEDELIPFKSENSEFPAKAEGKLWKLSKKKFFGCFIYHFAAFTHYILDFFFPYYDYPYYRIALEPSVESCSSPDSDVKASTSADSYNPEP